MASHARETVQFPRNVSNLMLRLNLYLFDHNAGKPYRINDPVRRSRRHAQQAGMRRNTWIVYTQTHSPSECS